MITYQHRRQTLVNEFGQKDQEKLAAKHAIFIGGGRLSSNSANLLVRMGA